MVFVTVLCPKDIVAMIVILYIRHTCKRDGTLIDLRHDSVKTVVYNKAHIVTMFHHLSIYLPGYFTKNFKISRMDIKLISIFSKEPLYAQMASYWMLVIGVMHGMIAEMGLMKKDAVSCILNNIEYETIKFDIKNSCCFKSCKC